MRTDTFFDANVLLYLSAADLRKADIAQTLVDGGGVISLQVLDEAASVSSRKYRLAWPTVRAFLDLLRESLILTPTGLETHELGLDVAERYGYSVYDSMLLAAALQAGCTTFWSEDLHHGQLIEGQLMVRNPFA